jgi:hypothetical protein
LLRGGRPQAQRLRRQPGEARTLAAAMGTAVAAAAALPYVRMLWLSRGFRRQPGEARTGSIDIRCVTQDWHPMYTTDELRTLPAAKQAHLP